jgi:CheY-like chemotaxis protein
MEKILLLAPKNFKLASAITYDKLETDDVNIFQILENIIEIQADILIIPAEQSIKGVDATCFSGLELIKHIRLTPELAHVNKKPIICLHWHTLDYYIKKDKENIFLYSNAIYTYRLPNFKLELEKYKELDSDLKPYLFGSDKDEKISEHILLNKYAIEQFEKIESSLIEKPLWYKKFYFKKIATSNISQSKIVLNTTIKSKILLLDDLATDWETAIKSIFTKLEIEKHINLSSCENKIKSIIELDLDKINNIRTNSTPNKKNLINEYCKSLFELQYGLIILDLYFSQKSQESLRDTDGYKLLEYIKKQNNSTPIILFSATLKDTSFMLLEFDNIVGHFVKGYSPVSYFSSMLERASVIEQINLIIHKAKLLLTDNLIYFTRINKKKMDNDRTQNTKNIIISIVDKSLLLQKRYIMNIIKEDVQLKIFDDIVAQIYLLYESCFGSTNPKPIIIKLKNIRHSIYHSDVEYPEYKAWSVKTIRDKLIYIDLKITDVFKSLVFNIDID